MGASYSPTHLSGESREILANSKGLLPELRDLHWVHLKEPWRRRYKLFIIMKDIMKEHIPKTTFDSWPPINSNLHNIFGSYLLFLKHVYCFYAQKICLYTSGLVCEDGSELPDDAIWTSATGPDTLQMVPWLTALKRFGSDIFFVKLWRPSSKRTNRRGKHIKFL